MREPPMKFSADEWAPLPPNRRYVEPPTPDSLGDCALSFKEDTDPFDEYIYRLSRVIHVGRTAFQSVLIADTVNYGRILVLDGQIQSAENDEVLYHEMLVQPAMLRHPEPQDILIIGGGEGATAREVLRHRSVKSVTMVDIDRELVQLCVEHLSAWHQGAFGDPRLHLVYQDGREFLSRTNRLYDVVIIDVVDMLDDGPAQALYTKQFYRVLRSKLKPGAIVAVQALEFSFSQWKEHAALARTLRTCFVDVHSYFVDIPSFFASWGFIIASDWFDPHDWSKDDIDQSIESQSLTQCLRHLDGEFFCGRLSMCKESKFVLSLPCPVLEDGVKFTPPPDIEYVGQAERSQIAEKL